PRALELSGRAVIDAQVDVRPVALDVPGEDLRVGRVEHDLVQPLRVGDAGDHVGSPGPDVLGDAFRLDHDHPGAGVEEAVGLGDGPRGVARPLGFQLGGRAGAAGAELD